MKLIDADLFLEEISKGATVEDLKKLVTECKGVPVTVDAVPVVRCKDCRHANECRKIVQYSRNEQNTVSMGYLPIEWCSRGERREP